MLSGVSFLTVVFWVWVTACVCALVQSLLLGMHAWEHRRFARRRRQDARPTNNSWRVALLSPCKGMDLELEQNLRNLLVQDYLNYEVLFIVETEDDPAFPIIQRLAAQSQVSVRIIVAGMAQQSGQKIHNLTVAAGHISPDVKILAFVDSDICPAPDWLGRMVARLYRPVPGAVTGYRWYVPATVSLANCLLCSINASIAALLGAGSQHIVWGGSWAMRRDEFETVKIKESWQYTLSDDLVATQALHAAELTIHYEPACMAASPMDYSLRGMLSFLRRQHLIGRIYAPRLWFRSLGMLVVSSAALVGAAAILAAGFVVQQEASWWAAGFLSVWYAFQVYRGLIRRDLARVYVSNWSPAMARCTWFDVYCAPLSLLVNTLVMLSACWGSRIVWRGIAYDLDPHGQIRQINRAEVPLPSIASMVGERQLRFDPPQPLGGANESSSSQLAASAPRQALRS
ncbi:MAG: Ceramide glucosyltransferase [Planctomycetaceae bacterium]|nr:Ceramide glucosyltransferase [Planctomycetaceae bacterium]